jgi:hypothetical protein
MLGVSVCVCICVCICTYITQELFKECFLITVMFHMILSKNMNVVFFFKCQVISENVLFILKVCVLV